MKKILLLALCCLALSGCGKEDVSKEKPEEIDYSNKVLVCSKTERNKADVTRTETISAYFEKDGTLKKLHKDIVNVYDRETDALESYLYLYDENSNINWEINKNVLSLSKDFDLPTLLQNKNRGTFDTEKYFWENHAKYDCQVKDVN